MDNSEASHSVRPVLTGSSREVHLVSLNFKVPFSVRQRFKIHAATQGMSMTELLLHLLADCDKEASAGTHARTGDGQAPLHGKDLTNSP